MGEKYRQFCRAGVHSYMVKHCGTSGKALVNEFLISQRSIGTSGFGKRWNTSAVVSCPVSESVESV